MFQLTIQRLIAIRPGRVTMAKRRKVFKGGDVVRWAGRVKVRCQRLSPFLLGVSYWKDKE
jgi:hypothetical protein